MNEDSKLNENTKLLEIVIDSSKNESVEVKQNIESSENDKSDTENPNESDNDEHPEIRHILNMENLENIEINENVSNQLQISQFVRCSNLIEEHLQELQNRIIGHTKAAYRYITFDRIIGYPVTLLASFLTSTQMVGLYTANGRHTAIEIIGLVISLLTLLLSASRDFFNYSAKHNEHNISSKLYTSILRRIENRLINNHIGIDERRDLFRDMTDQMSIIEQYELPIPNDIDKKIRANPTIPRSIQLGLP